MGNAHMHSKSEASENSLIWWTVSQLGIESSFVWYNDKSGLTFATWIFKKPLTFFGRVTANPHESKLVH